MQFIETNVYWAMLKKRLENKKCALLKMITFRNSANNFLGHACLSADTIIDVQLSKLHK